MTRTEILKKFRGQVANGIPLVGGGAGTGITVKSAEAGGIDLLVIYNSGRFRMAGRGSLSGLLAYGDANEIAMDMAREVLPVVKHTPVLAGVNGTDPFRVMPQSLPRSKPRGSPECRISLLLVSSMAHSAQTSRKLAWGTVWRST